ncbi:secretin N-terminal domain-containing protein [Pseudoalteromonas sp. XMcav11-Q]|uniref:secretin N-terminal domain-containing protein n=1 Tax=Pseudoalteromonas sp. XMcav11-Q TaxID=3136665 RepID=UPI0032C4AFFE
MAKTITKSTIMLVLAFSLSGCNSTIDRNKEVKQVVVETSYLNTDKVAMESQAFETTNEQDKKGGIQRLSSLSDITSNGNLNIDLARDFSDKVERKISVNALPLNDFIHYTFGELLDVSYLVEAKVKTTETPVTLELKESVSEQKLFGLILQVLSQNNVAVSKSEGVYYLHHLASDGRQNRAFGFGRNPSDVPNVATEVVQLVPIRYGMPPNLINILSQLVDAEVLFDNVQSMLTIQGKREQVSRAISLVSLLDSPVVYNKATAMLTFEYISSESFIEKVTGILKEEGIIVADNLRQASVKFIPLEHLGKVVVFATSDQIIDRISYWRNELDKPSVGAEQSFYIYHPKFARASDLGESLAPLLGGSYSKNDRGFDENSSSSSASTRSNNTRQSSSNKSSEAIEGEQIRLVVDERANALIFYSTGRHYQELLPIINKLDIMPKQVMMEVVIAEVKLTGSFSKGVEYALRSGASSSSERFNFNSKDGFNYSIVGLPGTFSINLNQSNGLVNVLSRPSLLVRDGVSANISVGDDIPTVGSTTTDPISGDRQTTELQYRKTGVNLTVTPTVNAKGTVIMSIEQNISNVSPDSSGAAGNPAIFERTLSTEVVASDGQTVMLGGLISENSSKGATSIPLLGDVPLLGHLFRSDNSSSDKTELVILVTPKIVHDTADWERVKESFLLGLENVKF